MGERRGIGRLAAVRRTALGPSAVLRTAAKHSESKLTVSVIIPTLNEAACLGETLRLLRLQRPHEILVSDGGSTDATPKLAAAADRLLVGARGRAAQMNLGAAAATGDVLLFLHA